MWPSTRFLLPTHTPCPAKTGRRGAILAIEAAAGLLDPLSGRTLLRRLFVFALAIRAKWRSLSGLTLRLLPSIELQLRADLFVLGLACLQ